MEQFILGVVVGIAVCALIVIARKAWAKHKARQTEQFWTAVAERVDAKNNWFNQATSSNYDNQPYN